MNPGAAMETQHSHTNKEALKKKKRKINNTHTLPSEKHKPTHRYIFLSEIKAMGFPGGSVVNNSSEKAGDTDSIPGPGRSHMPQSKKPCTTTTERAL